MVTKIASETTSKHVAETEGANKRLSQNTPQVNDCERQSEKDSASLNNDDKTTATTNNDDDKKQCNLSESDAKDIAPNRSTEGEDDTAGVGVVRAAASKDSSSSNDNSKVSSANLDVFANASTSHQSDGGPDNTENISTDTKEKMDDPIYKDGEFESRIDAGEEINTKNKVVKSVADAELSNKMNGEKKSETSGEWDEEESETNPTDSVDSLRGNNEKTTRATNEKKGQHRKGADGAQNKKIDTDDPMELEESSSMNRYNDSISREGMTPDFLRDEAVAQTDFGKDPTTNCQKGSSEEKQLAYDVTDHLKAGESNRGDDSAKSCNGEERTVEETGKQSGEPCSKTDTSSETNFSSKEGDGVEPETVPSMMTATMALFMSESLAGDASNDAITTNALSPGDAVLRTGNEGMEAEVQQTNKSTGQAPDLQTDSNKSVPTGERTQKRKRKRNFGQDHGSHMKMVASENNTSMDTLLDMSHNELESFVYSSLLELSHDELLQIAGQLLWINKLRNKRSLPTAQHGLNQSLNNNADNLNYQKLPQPAETGVPNEHDATGNNEKETYTRPSLSPSIPTNADNQNDQELTQLPAKPTTTNEHDGTGSKEDITSSIPAAPPSIPNNAEIPRNAHEEFWNQRFVELLEYKRQKGHVHVPAAYRDNPCLGIWVNNMRHRRQRGNLPQHRIDQLTAIGFEWSGTIAKQKRLELKNAKKWNAGENLWTERFYELLEYKKQKGHVHVPTKYPDNQALGIWVANMRRRRQRGVLSQDRIDQLTAIGFEWDGSGAREKTGQITSAKTLPYAAQPTSFRSQTEPSELSNSNQRRRSDHSATFEARYQELIEFKSIHGHCNVPCKYPPNPKLGNWVHNCRLKRKKGWVPIDRIERLDQIGFLWEACHKKIRTVDSEQTCHL